MTVSTTTNKIILIANGATNVFSFPFAVRSGGQSDIQVFTTDTSGNITQLNQPSQFSVTINAAVAPNPTPIGGSVNLVSTPTSGVLVTILRSMALTQPTSLANQGNLYQPVLESTDDNQEMQVQQVSELQGRAIVVAVSDPAPALLPPAAQRANKALVFDSSGNPIAGVIPASGVISSAMAPFVSAVSIAAAKVLLGYGTMANENIGAAGKGIVDDGSGNARVNQTVLAVATNQSPAAAQHMTNYVNSGTLVHTLPKLTTVFNGYELWYFCISGTATLSPNASDNFPGAAGGASVVLVVGQCARLIGDGVSAWQIFIGRIPGIGSNQTKTVLTSGAGTYSTPAGCRRLSIRMIGGGGGGGGSGTTGSNGGTTTFNAINATGGVGGSSPTGGAGGTGGTGSAALRIAGGAGGTNPNIVNLNPGGNGGVGPFGGGGGPGVIGVTNSGAGGVGSQTAGGSSFGGGGAGEYAEIIINSPAASYAYSVGIAGAAGTGGSGQTAGGSGVIIIDEYYD